MNNFKIISIEEYIRRADEILAAKKLKTRSGDFDFIKAAGYAKAEPVVEEKIEMPKEELAPVEPEVEIKEEIKEEPKDEDITFAYGLRKPEEEIATEDITRIKNIGDTYKGGNPKDDPKKVEVAKKEEKKEEPKLTREEFEKVLNVKVSETRLYDSKEEIRIEYNDLLAQIAAKDEELDNAKKEYNANTENLQKLQKKEKDIKGVLNGINSWDMECLAPIRDEKSTDDFISGIGDFFGMKRQELNQIVQNIKTCNERKEMLGKTEQRIREELTAIKKKFQDYIEEKYPKLESFNARDAALNELMDGITKDTGKEAIKEPQQEENKNQTLHAIPEVEQESQDVAFTPEILKATNVRNLNDAMQYGQPVIQDYTINRGMSLQ